MLKALGRLADCYRALDPSFRRRLKWIALASGGLGLCLGACMARPPRPLLVWNASASVPIGLYSVEADDQPVIGEMVIARLPARWQDLAGDRAYIPVGVPLVKYVAAVAGDTVCAAGPDLSINGGRLVRRLAMDRRGRLLPWWEGCRLLGRDDVFLLTPSPDSFDGRYLGPIQRGDVLGRARPLWLR